MRANILVLTAIFLGGCFGYTPLYQQLDDAGMEVALGEIRMDRVERNVGERRAAQLLRRKLSQTYPADSVPYTMNILLKENEASLAVQRDATDVRLELILDAELRLNNEAGDQVLRADIQTAAAYNVEDSPYGTQAGRDRALEAAVAAMAGEIRHRLSLFRHQREREAQGQ